MDGVITRTAAVHATAWKETFDEVLARHAAAAGRAYVPFDPVADYDRYVDGRARADGIRTFLAERSIHLPEGGPDDPPEALTVCGVANHKNEILEAVLSRDGVEVYEGSRRYLDAVREAGLRRAVVSASANTARVLDVAGIAGCFEARIDGLVADANHLAGKPAPDMFLAGAAALGLAPHEAVVFEDALAGVEAGRAGGFALVVGVDRAGQAADLVAHGADVVVADLADLLPGGGR